MKTSKYHGPAFSEKGKFEGRPHKSNVSVVLIFAAAAGFGMLIGGTSLLL